LLARPHRGVRHESVWWRECQLRKVSMISLKPLPGCQTACDLLRRSASQPGEERDSQRVIAIGAVGLGAAGAAALWQ
jgi:hypothetical protein